MGAPHQYLIEAQVNKLTEILDDALEYAVNHKVSAVTNRANLESVFTDGRIDPVKLNKLSRQCDNCIAMMDDAGLPEQEVQNFIDIRNDIMKALEEIHQNEKNNPLQEKREQVARRGMSGEVREAIESLPKIGEEIILSENNYREAIKTFHKKVEDFINSSACEEIIAANPGIYNENFFKQLDYYMQPYKNIAGLKAIPKETAMGAFLKDIMSDANMRNIESATIQTESFINFINQKKYKNFVKNIISDREKKSFTDYIQLSVQHSSEYKMHFERLNKNHVKIDPESTESKLSKYYLDMAASRQKGVNEKVRGFTTQKEEELQRLVAEKAVQQTKDFNQIKNDIVSQLAGFTAERDKQKIKLGGDLTAKALAAMQDINSIEVNGSDASVKAGLEEIGKVLNTMRVSQKSGLLQSDSLRKLEEKINKKFSVSELFVKFNQNDGLVNTIHQDLKNKSTGNKKITQEKVEAPHPGKTRN
jgi:hypothetical protein